MRYAIFMGEAVHTYDAFHFQGGSCAVQVKHTISTGNNMCIGEIHHQYKLVNHNGAGDAIQYKVPHLYWWGISQPFCATPPVLTVYITHIDGKLYLYCTVSPILMACFTGTTVSPVLMVNLTRLHSLTNTANSL